MNALRELWDRAGMALVCVALFIGVSLGVPDFLSVVNMKGLALSVATVGMISCTMMFCLAGGDFDLSVGSIVALAGVVAATVINHTASVPLGILAGVVAGGAVGVVNGVFIARLGINALITTLASMQVVRGLAFIVTDGKAIGVREESFFKLGIGSVVGIPSPVYLTLIAFLVFGFLLNRTIFGRNTLAIGGNREAANLAGISVTRTKIAIFILQGLMAGFAGVVLASRMASGQPNTAQGLELQVISACVLGGVSLTGGVATITGVMVGVLVMGTVQNAMNLLGIPPFYQYVASGAILWAAVLLDKFSHREME